LSTDVGDETQRNFRYQHAYGVVLLAAAYGGLKPFSEMYCEHHEDLLVRRDDGLWEAFQVKTRGVGQPPWKLTDDEIRDSIKRFVLLDTKHPGEFARFHFVSNFGCYRSQQEKEKAKCPEFLLTAIAEAEAGPEVGPPWGDVLDALAAHCGCDRWQLCSVLRRLDLVVGPGRDSFDAEVAHEHLGLLAPCRGFGPPQLNALRDELIGFVFRASSLQIQNPAKHLESMRSNDPSNPRLAEKRLEPRLIDSILADLRPVPFRFLPALPLPALGEARGKSGVLRRKLVAGGIFDQYATMFTRGLSAEQRLLELSYRDPERFTQVVNQLVAVVKGECDEAQLKAQANPVPYGREMLLDVYRRLRELSATRKEIIFGEEYECLAGVAALLTGECQVWWGPEFDVWGEP
jgi:hypothetical protein